MSHTTDRSISTTLIAHGVRVDGEFVSQGDVVIEGEVQGTVAVGGRLAVGTQAVVKANVAAEQASVAGTVEGNVAIAGHLEVKATARLMGDIACQTISVESGALISGRMGVGSPTPVTTKKGSSREAARADS